MDRFRKNPHIYEINLATWLHHLSNREKRKITLGNIPEKEWADLKKKGIDIIWLMGIWQRSLFSRSVAQKEQPLIEECRSVLQDFSTDDIAGSPYAVYDYVPDPEFGLAEALIALKKRLEERGLFLILDFVPNHTACDHPWINEYPHLYVHKKAQKRKQCPDGFFLTEGSRGKFCIAHGKDPYFPPWTDTAQVDYSNPGAIHAMVDLVSDISRYCHGFRCDMAMLVVSSVFRTTWADHIDKGKYNEEELWPLAIERVGSCGRKFYWIAEVYWGMEQELLNLGFDYVYDKTFYDLLVSSDVQRLKAHLSTPVAQQEKMLRFLENHDEQRAASVFGLQKLQSAMVIHATLPGMKLWHHGQLEGNTIRVPVQLRRGPEEAPVSELKAFCNALLHEVNHPVFHDGRWQLCDTSGWPDNQSHINLLAWRWALGEEKRLIVVNFSSTPAQGLVKVPQDWFARSKELLCRDPVKGESYHLHPADVSNSGLYVALQDWDFHFFTIERR